MNIRFSVQKQGVFPSALAGCIIGASTQSKREVEMKKCKWYWFLLAALVFLLATSVIACINIYTQSPEEPSAEPSIQQPPTTESPLPEETPSVTGGIRWDEACDHIGERTTVCGTVVSATWATGSKGKPTFLNIGAPYPDPDRFTVIIWGDYRGNFSQPPEDYYSGKTICVTGLIIEYQGIAEIEVKTPSQIQEQ